MRVNPSHHGAASRHEPCLNICEYHGLSFGRPENLYILSVNCCQWHRLAKLPALEEVVQRPFRDVALVRWSTFTTTKNVTGIFHLRRGAATVKVIYAHPYEGHNPWNILQPLAVQKILGKNCNWHMSSMAHYAHCIHHIASPCQRTLLICVCIINLSPRQKDTWFLNYTCWF